MRLRTLPFLALFATCLVHLPAMAQDPSPEQAAARASEAAACLAPLARRLEVTIQLLEDTRAQLRSSDAQVRRDAAAAVVSLEQRIDGLAEAIRGCVPRSARLETTTRVVDRQGVDARVGEQNAATQVIERDVPLVRDVHVVVAERVDGHGTVDPSLVRRAIRGVGSRLQQCYGRFLERGAFAPGQAIVAFTVTPSGGLQRVRVEGVTIDDRNFRRCLQSAASRMRIGGVALGGDARYAYTLRFGG